MQHSWRWSARKRLYIGENNFNRNPDSDLLVYTAVCFPLSELLISNSVCRPVIRSCTKKCDMEKWNAYDSWHIYEVLWARKWRHCSIVRSCMQFPVSVQYAFLICSMHRSKATRIFRSSVIAEGTWDRKWRHHSIKRSWFSIRVP